MIGYAWITDAYDDYYSRDDGKLPPIQFRSGQIVRVEEKMTDDWWGLRTVDRKYSHAILRGYIEFIPPHLVIQQTATNKCIVLYPNLDFANSYEDYEGLILTMPDGTEMHINREHPFDIKSSKLGFDYAYALMIAEENNFKSIESPSLIDVIYSFYTDEGSDK